MRVWQPTPLILPGEFPWTEEPGDLQSIGSQRVGHDFRNLERILKFIFTSMEKGPFGLCYALNYIPLKIHILKLNSGHRTGKGGFFSFGKGVFIPIPKKGNVQECSNYHTIALISHDSKVMLKILQARLQQYLNHDLPNVLSWI